jgi:hypothetical protein
MNTLFDYVTVSCFVCLVAASFLWTGRDARTLLHIVICGVAFAVADQIGNRGFTLLGLALVAAGIGYAFLFMQRRA